MAAKFLPTPTAVTWIFFALIRHFAKGTLREVQFVSVVLGFQVLQQQLNVPVLCSP